MKSFLRKPSAWLPIAMSLSALLLVVSYLAIFGVAEEPQADEGIAARIFQLLLAGQLPIIVFFAIKWLPQQPKQALKIVALQILAALLALAPVYILEM